MSETVAISAWGMGSFYLLLLIPLALFSRWQLGLSRSIVTAVLRMTLQLAVVGIYLQTLFDFQSPVLNLAWLGVMATVAGASICKRAGLPLKQVLPAVLTGQIVSLGVVLPMVLMVAIQLEPWWQAQYLIPVAGMLLGNSLAANVLALERWHSSLKSRMNEYQYYLALGAPHPAQPFVKEALKTALMPQLASMTTLGIVSLPGMMTGQILGGTAPLLAVKYQLVIMVAIFLAAVFSVATTLSLVNRFAFNAYGQLRL